MIVTVCECRREKCSEGGSKKSRRGLSDDVLVIVYYVLDDERDFEGRRLLEIGMMTMKNDAKMSLT